MASASQDSGSPSSPKNTRHKNANRRPRWLEFLTQPKPENSLDTLLGFFLLLLMTVSALYLNSKRIEYNQQFYALKFSINYLEFIFPGTKIRYQGALVVGTVQSVESDLSHHLLHVNIKHDFHIPKQGSRLTLQTWGYAGEKFINIDILPSYRNTDFYREGDTIAVAKVTPFSQLIVNMSDTIQKSDKKGMTVFETFLHNAQKTTATLSNSAYSQPNGPIKKIVRKVSYALPTQSRKIRNFLSIFHNKLLSARKATQNFVNKMNRYLPVALKTVNNLKTMLSYKPDARTAITKGYLHEEAGYYYLLSYLQYMNESLKRYSEQPSDLVFENGGLTSNTDEPKKETKSPTLSKPSK